MSADLRGGKTQLSVSANRDAFGIPNTPVGNAVARMRLGLGFVGKGWQPVIMALWEAAAYASACGRSHVLTCRDCANYEGKKRCLLNPRKEVDPFVAEGKGVDLCKRFKEYRREGGMSEEVKQPPFKAGEHACMLVKIDCITLDGSAFVYADSHIDAEWPGLVPLSSLHPAPREGEYTLTAVEVYKLMEEFMMESVCGDSRAFSPFTLPRRTCSLIRIEEMLERLKVRKETSHE